MRRLIEVEGAFPMGKVSEASRKEKDMMQVPGHISTLHTWWARRPLAASRATIFAALVPDPGDEGKREELRRLIERIAPWEAVKDGNSKDVEEARRRILEAFGGRPPKVLDCFAGGGSIPLEALRLGCETYALEYNPVAVLILKAVLEFPQKFGRPQKVRERTGSGMEVEREVNPLAEAVERWGRWVLEEARRELERFYPKDPDGAVPVGYIWARTIPCECGTEIPLMRQFWLAKKEDKKVALKPMVDKGRKRVDFEIVKGGKLDFDPSRGTVKGAKVVCPVCGEGIDDKTVRKLFREGRAGQRLVAVVLHRPGEAGRDYRLATERDLEAFEEAERALEEKRQRLWAEWGIDPVPDEPLPPTETLGFRVQRYGLATWGDLFNSRQKLALITFAEKVREAHRRMLEEGYDEEFARAVVSYLGLVFDRLADFCSVLCRWHTTRASSRRRRGSEVE